MSKKINLEKKFDLTISLEVAEHIEPESAEQFVSNLVSLSPVILFSAAIPLQGGSNHVNENWPEYWQAQFLKHDYVVIDCIRKKIWHDEKVSMWYVQNSFIYIHKDKISNYQKLQAEYEEDPKMLSVVHPRFYEFKIKRLPIFKAIKYKLQRSFGNGKK